MVLLYWFLPSFLLITRYFFFLSNRIVQEKTLPLKEEIYT
jgi:hypothetical protein